MTKPAKSPSKYDALNDADWLQRKYLVEDWSADELAEHIGCGRMTVYRHLARHGLTNTPEKRVKDSRVLDKNWLQREYAEKNRSVRDIAEELDYTRKHIAKWLDYHGIEVKSGGETTWYVELDDPEYLESRYHDEGLTLREMADEIGCSPKGVHRALKRHDIISTDSNAGREGANYCPFHTNTDGYEVWSVPTPQGSRTVFVHQLLVVASGVDPKKAFGGDYHCHHQNECPWDNREDNLEVVRHGEHTRIHNQRRWSGGASG